MKNWEEDDDNDYCAAAEDYEVAKAVCERLDIPLRGVSFAAEYWDQVFSRFLEDSAAGLTPNPDVLCNREIKFKTFLDFALSLGADLIATGHYVRSTKDQGKYRLWKAADANKDQSYFLYALGQRELGKTLFPLAGLTKTEVRALARRAGLPNHDKKDSTGLCFIGERPFKAFLARFLPPEPGEIRTVDGVTKGCHDGLMYYTLGQRHGLGVGGPGGPWYVVAKNTRRNILYIAEGDSHPSLFTQYLEAGDISWVAGVPPKLPLYCRAKIRYRQTEQPCVVEATPRGLKVGFQRAQRAATPGQAIVFYSDNLCLGGGVITRVTPLRAIEDRHAELVGTAVSGHT